MDDKILNLHPTPYLSLARLAKYRKRFLFYYHAAAGPPPSAATASQLSFCAKRHSV
ncbi:MAG: hypothetical protein LKE33_08230 [Acidaminococcus sp.]|jgi:hypothetical protein|nr:hypothetical protein [Acidaminococcus sp.]MCI2099729.1 hypothetical protein [Acidaminococcus sp.]MCI2114001.1 hypothetical protein [Acidaminococcus sp.]MCI2116110.1 hypothetical protein [Acidaminococcus sp.]